MQVIERDTFPLLNLFVILQPRRAYTQNESTSPPRPPALAWVQIQLETLAHSKDTTPSQATLNAHTHTHLLRLWSPRATELRHNKTQRNVRKTSDARAHHLCSKHNRSR